MSADVIEQISLVADAPDGFTRLRALIYALATEGRLVPGADHAEQTTLGRVATFEMGQAPPGSECNKDGVGTVFVKTGEFGKRYPEVREWTTNPLKFAKRGDVLICVVGATVGKLNLAIDCAIGRSVAAVRPSARLTTDYLYIALVPFTLRLREQSRGSAQGVIGKSELSAVSIRVPDVDEQHRIVAKVDELMALCDRLEARQQDAEAAHARLVQALLDSLTQARDADEFQACWQRVAGQLELVLTTNESVDAVKQAVLRLAFSGRLLGGTLVRTGEPQTALPDGWRELQLADIAVVGTGATPARTNPAYFDPPEFPWVTSGETSAALINATAQRVSAQALAETNLTIYPPGTLVVAMYGQGKTRGQVSELAIEACTNQACAAIQLKDPSPAHRQYVKYFFEKSYDELRELAAGGAQPNLNLGKIKSTLIPLPPLEEQRRIVAKVTELLALCDQLKARISAARAKYAQLAEALVAQAVA